MVAAILNSVGQPNTRQISIIISHELIFIDINRFSSDCCIKLIINVVVEQITNHKHDNSEYHMNDFDLFW